MKTFSEVTNPLDWGNLSKAETTELIDSLSKDPSLSPDTLRVLSEVPSVEVREEVAAHQNAPVDVLVKLAQDPVGSVRLSVGTRDQEVPLEALAILAKDKWYMVRWAAAECPEAPAEILTLLVGDPYAIVRRTVADHPNTPAEALSRLAGDRSEDVRNSVGAHLNTSPDTLAQLSTDLDDFVRWRVAANNNTPFYVLLQLVDDPHQGVANTARHVLKNRNYEDTDEILL